MRIAFAGLVPALSAVVATAQVAPPAPATPAGPVAATAPAAATAAGPVSTKAMTDYTLGVGDKVRITVFNEPTLTGEYPINANGRVSFPLVGEVQAAGLTPGRLGEGVQAKLADGYLNNPRVAVDVLTFRPFYILGEVTKPGEYPATAGLSVVNAVATAQGFTYRANKKWAYVKHAGQDREERVRLTADLPVAPGDTIRIGERFF